MRSASILALLLLTAGLAGCLGEQGANGSDATLQTATSDQAATLPPGLTMENAEEVSYNETAVVWSTTGRVAGATNTLGRDETTIDAIAFDVPAGLELSIEVNVTWASAGPFPGAEARLHDEQGNLRCDPTYHGQTNACHARNAIEDEPARWELRLDPRFAPWSASYEALLTMTVEGPAPQPDPSIPGLAEPPTYEVGDWWEVRLVDPLTRSTSVITTVVADVQEGTAYVGTSERLAPERMLLGLPGLGVVTMANLSWNARGETFQTMAFPPAPGASWETRLHGYDVQGQVLHLEGSKVHLRFTGEADMTFGGPVPDVRKIDLRAVYDAERGMLTNLTKGPEMWFLPGQLDLPTFEVLAHGSGYEGPVYVPTEQALVFDHGMRSSAVETVAVDDTLRGVSTGDRVEIQHPYTDLAFVQIVGRDLGHTAGDTLQQVGYYHEHAYWGTFDGESDENWEFVVPPTDVSGLHTAFHEMGDPRGIWLLARTSAGPGVSMTQGLAYTLLRYDAPGETPEVLT
ncbi:MAG: hypothetical protein R3185_02480 [Candidatus Thermoplasmatota archaeon]|nr:hypothetical protein [Candidatus Thermoplasmatota archaeon]